MHSKTALRVILPALGLLTAGIGIGRAFAPGTNLYLNGTLASTRAFEHNGAVSVPIADVAKALNLSIVARPDGYALAPAGGANQVNGLTGKIGDKLTNGQFVVTVRQVIRTSKYHMQFETGDDEVPDSADDDIVAVVFHIKNATQKSPFLAIQGGEHTALTDQDEHAYVSSRFLHDAHSGTPTLLPGSAVDFAVLFNFPKNQKLGDLVYQMRGSGGIKETDFRISLANATQQ